MDLSKRTILITGGSSGIGLEFARQLLAKGNRVIITGRNSQRLLDAKRVLPEVEVIASDASLPSDIEALFQKIQSEFPEMNVLINNAGIGREINLLYSTESLESFTREIEINLIGPVRMSRKFLDHLKRQPQAAIINVSSGLAFVPQARSPLYSASKAGVHSFTQSLRIQLRGTQVKVVEVVPPVTDKPILTDLKTLQDRGVKVMKVEDLVRQSIAGIEAGKSEILAGQSKLLGFMSRFAPQFVLKKMNS